MRTLIFVLVLSFTHLAAFSQYNKCVVNGVTTYQDSPCTSEGKLVDIKPSTGRSDVPQLTASGAVKPALPNHWERTRDYMAGLEKERLINNKKNQIANLQDYRSDLMAGLDRDLYDLKNEKRRANNNLAGATWEQSLSTEMQAITGRYQIKITDVDNRIKVAQEELRALQAK